MTGTRTRGISLFFVDEFQAFDMATTKSGQCSLRGSCIFGLYRQTRTISSIPFVCGRDFPSRICFSPVDHRLRIELDCSRCRKTSIRSEASTWVEIPLVT
ncbi:hypothetical protein AVEN_32456-1 [Araneus ventricosus]|uniref:Uncharacterized protein n=1 Tax=Araneus ventricosus TaxID=182803 RepID=A0A4Y2X4W9_ARAVE|nr:hypothetical protein AVEN_17350-1 [Araneus ventricosus]GBO44159.1 hypothetical protein AVEN_32456-1 [Araneus ventricosus]